MRVIFVLKNSSVKKLFLRISIIITKMLKINLKPKYDFGCFASGIETCNDVYFKG